MTKLAIDNIKEAVSILKEIRMMASAGYSDDTTRMAKLLHESEGSKHLTVDRSPGDGEQFFRIMTRAQTAEGLLNTVLLDATETKL